MKKLLYLFLLIPAISFGQLKISQLTENTTITGAEEIPLAKSGANYKENFNDLLSWMISSSFTTTPITVDVATTAALAGSWTYNNGAAGVGATLTRTTNGALATTDGVASVAGNTYLIKNFTGANRKNNGVYTLTTVGSAGAATVFTRLGSGDESSELDGQVVIPSSGTTNARRVFSQTTATPTVGTSNLIYIVAAAGGGNIRSDGTVDFTATQSWDDGSLLTSSVSPSTITNTNGTITATIDVDSNSGLVVTDGTNSGNYAHTGMTLGDGAAGTNITSGAIDLGDGTGKTVAISSDNITYSDGVDNAIEIDITTPLANFSDGLKTISLNAATPRITVTDGTNSIVINANAGTISVNNTSIADGGITTSAATPLILTADGALSLKTLSNGNINLQPDGTGIIKLTLANVPNHADNAAAVAAGLTAGTIYRTSSGGTSTLKIVE